MSIFTLKSLRTNLPRTITLSEQAESIICDGFCRWVENREYRNPNDNIRGFAESLGVTEEEVAMCLRIHLDIKYGILKCLLRIQDASTLLLLYPHTPLSHISRLIGYSDLKHFLWQFKACTRHNPGRWHRRIVAKREAARPTRDEHRPANPTLKTWCPIFRNY